MTQGQTLTPEETLAITVPAFDPSLAPSFAGLIYENPLIQRFEQGLDTLGQHVVVLDPGGRVEFATDGARRLLGDTVRKSRGVPEAVRDWISQHRDLRAAAQPLHLQTAEGTVLVRLLPGKRTEPP